MKHTEGTLTTQDGFTLYKQAWKPEGVMKAAVAIVHGFGEHSDRYMNAMNCFMPAGYTIYSFDLRGHGRSEGKKGCMTCWDEYSNDVQLFITDVKQDCQGAPLFLWGHSLGGLIALDYAQRSPEGLRGVIATGPLVGEIGVSPVMVTLSKVMSRIWPSFSMDIHLDASAVSRDQAVVEAYRSDPRVHSIATARLGTEISATRSRVNQMAPQFTLPLLVMQGGDDRLTPADSTRAYFDKVASKDKRFILYPDAYHELHNDLIADQALTEMQHWMGERLNQKRR
jgi:alpha-beta hydrolase superfamily lysophospholipase